MRKQASSFSTFDEATCGYCIKYERNFQKQELKISLTTVQTYCSWMGSLKWWSSCCENEENRPDMIKTLQPNFEQWENIFSFLKGYFKEHVWSFSHIFRCTVKGFLLRGETRWMHSLSCQQIRTKASYPGKGTKHYREKPPNKMWWHSFTVSWSALMADVSTEIASWLYKTMSWFPSV